ncbi:MAG: hypothetical protein FD155_2291 [Bacteroidetes bacterium]|nr:MAG: hypothetical protein FD155_2291 [Bacteroidota bacterium]
MKKKGKKKSKKRKIKFKEVKFKLSEKQYRSLTNYCKARKTTIIKLIKKSIDKYANNYDVQVPKQFFVSERQLDLFGDTFSVAKEEQNFHID